MIAPTETTPTLPAEDFAFLSKLMHERAAIVLEPGKEYLALSRLDPLVREQGCGSVSGLIERLRLEAADSPLLDLVVDALTTNETMWFRDLEPFESLRRTVLPELIERRGHTRTLAIWSAGCSTGQEPFSIAMTIREHFPELASWNLTILGSDISPSVLERARRGRYGQLEVNRGLPAHLLVRHFTRAGMEWEIEESIRRMVRFQRRNLITDWQGLPPFDLILMRNVMIYFDVESKRDVLTHMHHQLATNGYLLLGSSETTFNLHDDFERQVDGRTAWYRPVQPGQTDPIGGAGR